MQTLSGSESKEIYKPFILVQIFQNQLLKKEVSCYRCLNTFQMAVMDVPMISQSPNGDLKLQGLYR